MSEEKMTITDELLAAFLDGNVSVKEVKAILKAAEEDSSLREFLSIAADVSDFNDNTSKGREALSKPRFRTKS